jgi:hypothetical protein
VLNSLSLSLLSLPLCCVEKNENENENENENAYNSPLSTITTIIKETKSKNERGLTVVATAFGVLFVCALLCCSLLSLFSVLCRVVSCCQCKNLLLLLLSFAFESVVVVVVVVSQRIHTHKLSILSTRRRPLKYRSGK